VGDELADESSRSKIKPKDVVFTFVDGEDGVLKELEVGDSSACENRLDAFSRSHIKDLDGLIITPTDHLSALWIVLRFGVCCQVGGFF